MILQESVHPPVFDERLTREFEKYKGQYVAIDNGNIVAHGERLADVYREARAQGVTDPRTFHVPLHWGRMMFL
jgi:Family of unknown function (DUF5678)